MGPWAALPMHRSLLAETSAQTLQPYLQAAGLANGYRFFAPNPGPSHLVRYEVLLADGTKIEGRFPNHQEHQPRLLYHRYFMLSEFLNSIDDPQNTQGIDLYTKSYARHLAREHAAKQVKIWLVRHALPSMVDVRRGLRLDDPTLYDEELLGTFDGESL